MVVEGSRRKFGPGKNHSLIDNRRPVPHLEVTSSGRMKYISSSSMLPEYLSRAIGSSAVRCGHGKIQLKSNPNNNLIAKCTYLLQSGKVRWDVPFSCSLGSLVLRFTYQFLGIETCMLPVGLHRVMIIQNTIRKKKKKQNKGNHIQAAYM
ncbi:hypothetical protein P175DRAFT_010817 [Aspergillus ochraceoroseus IBT 24754]|uniref:Uncharacterized protein n=1 Tax=Aspergillus ochraceoroseus IBT 24754 TaxID=1392256 RepID=A0A2T5M5X4_9EURO|nr:uncharacterized protein P175DRAFT_010817 [Aspergillus ochraceoroseus IBT 24754]PTU23930.1 hypothetical protein P175DRAFT_010817 [Aspergillus ochraceoroseus IBT 24754]